MQSDARKLWRLLDEVIVELNRVIPHRDEKVRDGSIDHPKLDREKVRGEALGIARCIVEITGMTLDAVREEAASRYDNRRRRTE